MASTPPVPQEAPLTTREQFAAMAMQGLLSGNSHMVYQNQIPLVADTAVKIADALIEALAE